MPDAALDCSKKSNCFWICSPTSLVTELFTSSLRLMVIGSQVCLPATYTLELYTSSVTLSKVRLGLVMSMTCLVSSDLGVDTPKFSRIALKRYCSFGINKPCDAEL